MRKSDSNVSPALKKEVGTLLYAFHVGKERRVTARQLAERLNHKDTTQVRAAISELVTEGHPIGSTMTGYFVLSNADEAVECYRHLESRTRKIARRLAGLKRAVRAKFGNQLFLIIDDPVRERPTSPEYEKKVKEWYGRVACK